MTVTDQQAADDIAESQEAQAADDTATSFLSVIFTDDHNIEGMKVTVRNITPLQITAAIYYLQRAANRLADAIEAMQEAKRERDALIVATDIRNVAQDIQRGRGSN